jgi:MFS family permease
MHSQPALTSPRVGDQREGLSAVRWLAVTAIGLSIFLSALDATIVALASPIIARQFHLSDSLASAIFLAYSVPLTLLILPSAELMRRFRTLPCSSWQWWGSAWAVSSADWRRRSRRY